MKTAIIIPTYNRISLLTRLLQSISEAAWPESFSGVWVVENGRKAGSDKVVADFSKKLAVHYLYEDQPGPSFARNRGIQEAGTDYFVFFDDDIRIGRDTLLAYENAFRKYGNQAFFGGPLKIDYEQTPEDWLLEFFPWSAQGTDLGSVEKFMTEPLFLGANHAIPGKLLDQCGDFDPFCPVGQTGMLGEETRLQKRLLDSGAKGVYVPDAVVWHFVPAERCSENWALERRFRRGLSDAAQLAPSAGNGRRFLKVPLWIWKEYFVALLHYLKAAITGSPTRDRFSSKAVWWRTKGLVSFFRKGDTVSD